MEHLEYFEYYAAKAQALTDEQLYKVATCGAIKSGRILGFFSAVDEEIIKRWIKGHENLNSMDEKENNMDVSEINIQLDAIIDKLNEIIADNKDSGIYGVHDVELALDLRRDMLLDEENYHEPTPEELKSIKEECERNKIKFEENHDKTNDLLIDYFVITSTYPRMYNDRYVRNYLSERF